MLARAQDACTEHFAGDGPACLSILLLKLRASFPSVLSRAWLHGITMRKCIVFCSTFDAEVHLLFLLQTPEALIAYLD